jgi:hypothetical protein
MGVGRRLFAVIVVGVVIGVMVVIVAMIVVVIMIVGLRLPDLRAVRVVGTVRGKVGHRRQLVRQQEHHQQHLGRHVASFR